MGNWWSKALNCQRIELVSEQRLSNRGLAKAPRNLDVYKTYRNLSEQPGDLEGAEGFRGSEDE